MPLTPRTTLRLVALGDSTVEGLEDPRPDGSYAGWADRFAGRLAAAHPGLLYANLAVRGQTTGEVRATQLDPALALRPDVALIAAGVNDVLKPRLDRVRLRANLDAMYRALTGGGARVLTFTMPDMTRVAPLARALRPRIAVLNAAIRELGAANGVLVADLAAEPIAGHPALWHDDRLHANSEGHRRMAAALAEAYGLDAEEWRTEPDEPLAIGLLRVLGRESAWVAGHLAPWLWGRVRHQPYSSGGICKRPDLTPVVPE
jgi:lysophospholipase L1-like esterase